MEKVTKKTKTEVKKTEIEEQQNIPSTQAARIAGGKAGREQKARYLKLKVFVLGREKENYSKLFLIHEKDHWWKMIGHSAVMYHYEVSKWIGMSSRLRQDTDYDYKSEDGIVSIRDVYALDQKLTSVNIGLIKSTNDYRVYNLGKKFTHADIERMRKSQELEWQKVNSIVIPKEVLPTLHTGLRELVTNIYFATKKLEAYAREIFGQPMLEKAMEMLRDYSLLCAGAKGTTGEYLEKVENEAKWLKAQMMGVAELRMLPAETIYRILRSIDKVERIARQCQPRKI